MQFRSAIISKYGESGMTFYQAQFILTELLMISMILHVFSYRGFTSQQRLWFLHTFVTIMLCSTAEFLVHGVTYRPSMRIFLTVITLLQFSFAPILGVLFSGALGVEKQKKTARFILGFSFAVEIAFVWSGKIFKFTEAGYERGSLFILYGVCFLAGILHLVINLVKVGKRFSHRDSGTIIMVIIILIAGIVPMTLFKINVSYIAIAICSSICYIYYNDLVQMDSREKILGMQEHIISSLANLIESRDTETGEHIFRTREYVKKLAIAARKDGVYTKELTDDFILLIHTLAPLHDIGKIVVSDKILKKPGKLTEEERQEMKKHAAAGGRIVKEVLDGISDQKYVSFAADIAKYHHERWDGTGYPEGLKGSDIPLSARIMAVADVFDALISKRCYKEPIPFDQAVEEMKNESGTHFDPELIKVFLRHKEEFRLS